jgi:predicted RNA-binding protein YlqC (UPF0109 family)
MKKAVENLVSRFVDEPDAVEVSEMSHGNSVSIEVRVAKKDMGRLIGKRGRTVRAIRSLLYFAGQKQQRKYILNIVEE